MVFNSVIIDESTTFKRTIYIGIIIGIISGFGAVIFFEALNTATHFFLDVFLGFNFPEEGMTAAEISGWSPPPQIWLFLPLVCFGALVSGILVFTFAPEAEGHGTDVAIKVFHNAEKVSWKVPVVKAVASVFTIATGGSAGREGPTAQIAAGLGSVAAQKLHFSERERRIAIASGIGAGIGTIFKAPLGGAILAAEILYTRDIESEAIIPGFLATVIGYSIFSFYYGFDPIFAETEISWSTIQIPLFLLLGVVCAAIGLLYVWSFYGTKHVIDNIFKKFNIPPHVKPVTGAFVVGMMVIGLCYISPLGMIIGLGSIGSGYGFMQLSLFNMLPLAVLVFLPFTKIITTSFTIGSGGSGGVFAPGLMIGCATGGAVGMILYYLMPDIVPLSSVPVFAIVGMISLFGGIANSPISVMIMVIEMTGNLSLLVPAMGAVAVSYILTGEKTIYIQQVTNKASSPAHRGEYEFKVLEDIMVSAAMVGMDDLIVLSPVDSAEEVIRLIDETAHTGYPVIEDGRLVGIVTSRNLKMAGKSVDTPVSEIMTDNIHVVYRDTSLEGALIMMIDNDIHHLPVVDRDKNDRMIGFLTSTDIMRSYSAKVSKEQKKK